jgi:hypothetical protein
MKHIFCLMLFSLMSVIGYSQRVYVADYDGDVLYIESDVSMGEMPTEAETEAEAISGDKVTDCKYKGVPLHGKVKIVESFPDFKVKVVESFPDLKVKLVESFPDECGKWRIVDSFPDFTIQIVESFPDFTIKMVECFPGMP